jgi:hypothetical protein
VIQKLEAVQGVRIRFGEGHGDWIEVMPQVQVEELADRDRLITIKGVFRLQGNSPTTFVVTKLV